MNTRCRSLLPKAPTEGHDMDGDPISRQVDTLCSQVTDVRPCLDGEVYERHETLLEGVQALASMAEDQLTHERTERTTAEASAKHLQDVVQGLHVIVWMAELRTGSYSFVSHHAEEALGYP